MNELKFIYFEGCPNANKVRNILCDLGIKFEVIEQTSLPEGNPNKAYSSPTILKENEVIFGSEAEGGGCSLNIPNKDYFKRLLKK
ncbi:MAG: hypothetical protein CME60_00865 [Halobacteriovoraceae bacterium]|nr:hypothetical protein [Halobacteriovoraceae bacterium]|tara:strand:+ start:46800 stop:47054 length:255 start_codon:yes stop_codon:yes gene_type:complete